jgi:hypothetical protein
MGLAKTADGWGNPWWCFFMGDEVNAKIIIEFRFTIMGSDGVSIKMIISMRRWKRYYKIQVDTIEGVMCVII